MDLEAYEEGTLLYIGVKEGESVAVDAVLAVIGEKGANFKVLLDGSSSSAAPTAGIAPVAEATAQPATESAAATENGRVKASPLAKAIAEEKGINLTQVHGTGPDGRIVKADVESFKPGGAASIISQPVAAVARPAALAPQPAPTPAAETPKPAVSAPALQPAPATTGDYEDIPLSQMRKTIARRLSESMFTAPHFYLTIEINMDKAIALRGQINAIAPAKISFNDFVIKSSALALKQHPNVNASWLVGTPGGDKIRKYNYVNIGVAVAVEDGLLVPVVRNADQKTLSTIAGEVKTMAGKAKEKKLQPKDWEGSTFSISNLGMFGIEEFTAIINPPDACIMAVGAIKESVKFVDGIAQPTNVMKVTLSCDHRVVDGATGAAFLQTVKGFLEEPMKMLV